MFRGSGRGGGGGKGGGREREERTDGLTAVRIPQLHEK